LFFFSSRRRHTRLQGDWSSDVCSSDLAGSMQVDLTKEPLGNDKQGKPVYLADIWPSTQEVFDLVDTTVKAKMFKTKYASVFDGRSEERRVGKEGRMWGSA